MVSVFLVHEHTHILIMHSIRVQLGFLAQGHIFLSFQAKHAPVMWSFLIAFAEKKPFYRSLIIQAESVFWSGICRLELADSFVKIPTQLGFQQKDLNKTNPQKRCFRNVTYFLTVTRTFFKKQPILGTSKNPT